jgi:hypothetical protein
MCVSPLEQLAMEEQNRLQTAFYAVFPNIPASQVSLDGLLIELFWPDYWFKVCGRLLP